MESKRFPKDFFTLIQLLKKFPGIGSKTAEKLAFHLLEWDDLSLTTFSRILGDLKKKIIFCKDCGALLFTNDCIFCDPNQRKTDTLCIVNSPKDIYHIEETSIYQGLYFVLTHLLSPKEGLSSKTISIEKLKARIEKFNIKEVILALDSTLEGDTTALFIKNSLSNLKVDIYRLAFGLPVGSSLEFADGGTLSRSLMGRQKMN